MVITWPVKTESILLFGPVAYMREQFVRNFFQTYTCIYSQQLSNEDINMQDPHAKESTMDLLTNKYFI